MKRFRLILISILWDSELNTRKACLHSEHDNNDGGKSSDTEILDRPAKIVKRSDTEIPDRPAKIVKRSDTEIPDRPAKIVKRDNQNVPSSTSNKPMGEAELISTLHNYIKSLGDADTLE
jgi:hypothetical protein